MVELPNISFSYQDGRLTDMNIWESLTLSNESKMEDQLWKLGVGD